jgi:DNA polymerase-3 subunit delta'
MAFLLSPPQLHVNSYYRFIISCMLFKNVIGQQQVKQRLINMLLANRLSHALLFLGRQGSGALPLAISFANYISLLPNYLHAPAPGSLTTTSLFDGDVANDVVKLPSSAVEADAWMLQQPSFSKAAQLIHPDIHFSFPVVPKKAGQAAVSCDYSTEWREFLLTNAYGNVYDWLQFIGAENKQGNITAQECNEIMRKLSLKSFESGYKILILWMPEYLGREGNKLLKLIEEPPTDTLFILVAENEANILPTILSRCQLVKVPAIESKDIEAALIEKSNISVEQAHQIALTSTGDYREALHLVQHADHDFHGLLREWLNASLKPQVGVLKIIEEIVQLGRETQKQFLMYFTQLLEQAIRLETSHHNNQELTSSLSASESDFVSRLNKMMNLEQKNAISEEIDKAAYYIERNANPKLLFHALSIKVFHIVKNKLIIAV